MDDTKFKERILSLIKDSLPIQGLQKVLAPLELIEHRDRYFLIRCRNGATTKNTLFLRYDRWFFYLHGITSIPQKYKRRGYDYLTRNQSEKPDLTLKKKREMQERERLKKADLLIRKLSKEVRRLI